MNNTNYADIVKHDILYRVYAGRAVYGGGRADVVVKTKERVYVFEFKLDTAGIAEGALKQIDEKGQLIPYTADGRKLVKVGMVLDTAKRTLGEWRVCEG